MNKNLKAESVKVGKDGKDGVSITGPDTANGTDGKVAVTDKKRQGCGCLCPEKTV